MRASTSKKLQNRKIRVRDSIKRNNKSNRLRLSVFRSNKHIYAQIIDDIKGVTLASSSTMTKTVHEKVGNKTMTKDAARVVGEDIAMKASKIGITTVVFDKGPYKFHGVVEALAEAARKNNILNF